MSQFSDKQLDALRAPLDAGRVLTRSQSGRNLSYIEGWWAISEANRIFGYDGWTRETVDIRCVSERECTIGQRQLPGWSVTYIAKVIVRAGGVVREGCGAGHGIAQDLGGCHESALKEAETDAMKRALMTFGNPFGLALYDKTHANVEAAPSPARAAKLPNPTPHVAPEDMTDWDGILPEFPAGTLNKKESQAQFSMLQSEMRTNRSVVDLSAWAKARANLIWQMTPEGRHYLRERYDHLQSTLPETQGA